MGGSHEPPSRTRRLKEVHKQPSQNENKKDKIDCQAEDIINAGKAKKRAAHGEWTALDRGKR